MTVFQFQLIIDECVSNNQLNRFEVYAKKNRINFNNRLKVADTHSGIPDTQIIHHLLSKCTVLVTNDRPFHNKVLSKGLKSFYVDDERVFEKLLPGIKVKPDIAQTKHTDKIKSNYHPPVTSVRSFLLPSLDKELKRLTTKRRRIRNHFGGLENLEQIALTVSLREVNTNILIGIKIRVSSNVGVKALDASESYMIEKGLKKYDGIIAINYALIAVILLMLNGVKTIVYFDSDVIDSPKINDAQVTDDNDFYALFFQLYKSFEQIEFVPTYKGNLIDRLRIKLANLSKGKSNEVKVGNLVQIIEKIKQG